MSNYAASLPKLLVRCTCADAVPRGARLLCTTALAKRQPLKASTRSSVGPQARQTAKHRPQFRSKPNVERNAFKLSPDLPAGAYREPSKSDVLEDLRSKVEELADLGRGNMSKIVAALATRLGLDIAELQGFAATWAKTDPFTASKDQHRRPGLEGFDIHGVMTEMKNEGARALDRAVLSYFLRWLREQVSRGKQRMSPTLASIVEALDLRHPGEWYPLARAQKRKLILHVGPTNSGKTYNALCALAKAKFGAFAGPLRLLATEVYNRFNAGTIGGLTPESPRVCNLVTGEEKKIHDPLAGLESCTVEMMSLVKTFDVVVIDEIQMIGNPDRGAAWTTILLGLKAKEIHLCGEPSVVDLIKRIGAALGDEVEVRTYERLSPLRVAEGSLRGDLSQISKGDCVVTFSRNNIFAIKRELEETTGLKVAVAYGGLPPEVREEQARGFNATSANGGYDVMVASDAIGMGLNLKIKRIIFETMHKWDGRQSVQLSVSQIKQIGGRAGRFGVNNTAASGPDEVTPDRAEAAELEDMSNGVVTCLEEEDMAILREAMAAPMEPITKAALHPTAQQLVNFTSLLPSTTTQQHVFEIFPIIASASPDYFVPAFGNTLKTSNLLIDIPDLTVAERWQLGLSPVNVRDPEVVKAFVSFVTSHARHEVFEITRWQEEQGMAKLLQEFRTAEEDYQVAKRSGTASKFAKRFATSTNLASLETMHRCIVLYQWLHQRAQLLFPQQAEARLLKIEVQDAIDFILEQMSFKRQTSPNKRVQLPAGMYAGSLCKASPTLGL